MVPGWSADMANPSKNKGTRQETTIVRYLQANGFPNAHRQPLAGNRDIGDVWVAPWVILESKYRSEAYSAADVDRWLDECEQERVNASADSCWLVVNRPGKASPEHWRMYKRLTNGLVAQYRFGEWVAHVR